MKYVNLPVIFSVILPKKLKNDIIDEKELISMENTSFTNIKNVFLLLKERMCR